MEATGPIPLNNSKSIASVTLGSSSPTYKLAEGEVPDVAAPGPPGAGEPSSPEGDGDSLGEGTDSSSSGLESAGADSASGSTTGLSS